MSDTVTNETPAPIYRNRSAEIAKLAAALCKAQGAMEEAKKNANNPHFNRPYADLASVWDAVRKPLTDNGLSVVQFPRTAGNGVEIETTLLHVSGEFMCDILWMPCGKLDAQAVGSAITYGRRYALASVCGIAPAEDDGNDATDRSGVAGSAGGGTDFRPARRRANWVDEARNDGTLDEKRPKGTAPGKPDLNAIKMAGRVKKAIAFFKDDLTTHESAVEYWREREDPIAEIEAAMPREYERMLDAYNACLERTSERAV